MNAITPSDVSEIKALHERIVGHARDAFIDAMRIGEILTAKKAELSHGAFGPWVAEHLPFTDRTARNYMRLHEGRDRLKTESVSDLSSAYALLADTTNNTLEGWLNEGRRILEELRPEFNEALHGEFRKFISKAGYYLEGEETISGVTKIIDLFRQMGQRAAENQIDAERKLGEGIIELKGMGYSEGNILALINGRLTPEGLVRTVHKDAVVAS